jgi:hypothetical protein
MQGIQARWKVKLLGVHRSSYLARMLGMCRAITLLPLRVFIACYGGNVCKEYKFYNFKSMFVVYIGRILNITSANMLNKRKYQSLARC